jgi:hypothetical protein
VEFFLWWIRVLLGVFAKSGVQTWCFCMVNVDNYVVNVWLEMPLIQRRKMGQVSGVYFPIELVGLLVFELAMARSRR